MSRLKGTHVTIQVPKAELAILRETLKLSRHREKDPVKFIEKTAPNGRISYASSTIAVSHWKHLQKLAGKLGVASPI